MIGISDSTVGKGPNSDSVCQLSDNFGKREMLDHEYSNLYRTVASRF